MSKNKTHALFAALLVCSIVISSFALQNTVAQSTGWKQTYPFIDPIDDPVGVGQECLIWFGITDPIDWPATGWVGLTITVTKPDGTIETLGPFHTDTTGSTGTVYVPKVAGNYTLQIHFPEQIAVTKSSSFPANTTMKASDSNKVPLTVTENPQPHYPTVPLPTEYWSRPINAQAYQWSSISGSFLYNQRSTDIGPTNVFVNGTQGPETAHILWSRQSDMGGLVGGDYGDISFEDGSAYEGKFTAFIIGGILYRNAPWPSQSHYQSVTAIDLKTGEVLWEKEGVRLSYGQLLYWSTMNMMGVYPYLWEVNGSTWNAYDAFSGHWWYTMKNVPTGTVVYGPNGEILIYTIDLKNGWMTMWNSTSVEWKYYLNMYRPDPQTDYWAGRWRPYGLTLDGKLGIDWNVTIPKGLPGSVAKVGKGVILGSNAAGLSISVDPTIYWAISTKKGQEGQLLYQKSYPVTGNATWSIRDVSVVEDTFVVASRDTLQWNAYSLSTGEKLWGPTAPQDTLDWVGFAQNSWVDVIAYGKLYSGSFSGVMHCYDIKTGKLLWTYTAPDEWSESMMGKNWCLGILRIADGKIYIGYHEHSYFNPKPQAAPTFCLDAETGELLWKINMCTSYRDMLPIIGEGVLVYWNAYDSCDYAIAKGPSAITVAAPDAAIELGKPVVIKGMVTDISPGTKESIMPMRFPNGVPAVSDESMSEWMQYAYMQLPKPTNVTGVEVTLSVLDSNNNYREIGKTTSDADGFFSYQWTPDIVGKFTVTATFAGSKSYYPSHAENAFTVVLPQATSTTQAQISLPPFETYIVAGFAAVIVAVAVVGALLFITLKKRP